MQVTVDLDEFHRARVASEDREHGRAQVPAPERVRVGRLGRDRRRPLHTGEAKAVHDVFGLDARPHHHSKVGELRANVGEIDRERALRGVELGGSRQQCGSLGVVPSSLVGAARQRPVAGGIADGCDRRHGTSSV